MKSPKRLIAGLTTALAGLVAVSAAQAATVTVTVSGLGDGSGSCAGTSCTTLRAAITAINGGTFAAGSTIQLNASTYVITSYPPISAAMTVNGTNTPGSGETKIDETGSFGPSNGVLDIANSSGLVTVSNVEITGGYIWENQVGEPTQDAIGGGAGGGGGGGSGGGGGGTPIPLASIIAALGHVLTPSGKGAQIGGLINAGAITLNFTAPSAGVAVISWSQVPPGAQLTSVKRAHKPVLVASGRTVFAAAGSGKVKVKLTAAGRKLLRHARRVSLTAVGSFTPKGQAAVTKTRKFTLKR